MDYLQQLLKDQTVEWKKLGEVAQYSKTRIDASLLNENNYVGVDNLLQNCKGKTFSEHVPTTGRFTAYAPKNILIGNIRPYLKKIWFADNEGGTNGDVLVIQTTDERVLPEYLYQVLSDDAFFSYDMQHAKGAKMPRGNKDKILDYIIPLPPLSVQSRIVEILDKFTALEAELEQQLQAELELRKKQYQHYREQLLNFSSTPPHEFNVIWRKLGEVCTKVCSGGTPSTKIKEYYKGNIPWLRTQDIDWKDVYDTEVKITEEAVNNSSAQLIPANCVIVAMYGATAAKACINRIPLTTNQACCNLLVDESIANYKYVYYWICREYERLRALGEGCQSNLSGKKIKDYIIPLPPLSVQSRIVEILDKFDALTNSITEGLPLEIKLRRQQYEYYREQLLNFPHH